MKKFYWKAFIKKSGKINFIIFIAAILITIPCIIWITKEYGIVIVAQGVGISIIYDNIKEFIKIAKEANNEYTIEK